MINRYSVLLLIMLISCLSFNSYSQETKKVTFKNSNPPYKETFYVLKTSPEHRHGEYTRTSSGKLQVRGQYENNSKVGAWEFYDRQGQLVQKYNYSTDIIEYDKTPSSSKYDTLLYSRPPLYPGGTDHMVRQWMNNLEYPAEAVRKGVQGDVKLEVHISEDGKMTNITVLQGIGFGCDEEAVRIFKLLSGEWIPALDKEGKPTAAAFEVPFKFRLN